jgi:hypothetical protein
MLLCWQEVLKKRHTILASLLSTVNLALATRFNQYFVNHSPLESLQGKNVPGFEIPIAITGLFLLVSFLAIRRED